MDKRKGMGIFAFILFAVFGLSAVVMWLWNYAVVPVFNIGPLSYWQAMALLVLSKILLGGFRMRPGGYRSKWRNKWGKMSDEERDRFKEEWKQRCQERKKIGGK